MKTRTMVKGLTPFAVFGLVGMIADFLYVYYYIYFRHAPISEFFVTYWSSPETIHVTIIALYSLSIGVIIVFWQMKRRSKESEEKLENELKHQIDLNVAILRILPVAFIAVSKGRVIKANNNLRDVLGLGRETLSVAADVKDFVPEEDWATLKDAFRRQEEGQITRVKIRIRTVRGVIRLYEWHGSVIPDHGESVLIAIGIDVTDQEKNEELRLQEATVSLLRELASGVAHDFLNIITGISGSLELVCHYLGESDIPISREIDGRLQVALKGSFKAAKLAERLLTFSQKVEPRKIAVDLRALIAESVKLAESGTGRKVKLNLEKAGVIEADPNLLSQVIVNLVINALQAGPGEIRVLARRDKDEACITVADNGQGINPAIRGKIFQPYFSTKGNNGHGMGLAMCRSIIESHSGSISVESQPGRGAVFTVVLPVGTCGMRTAAVQNKKQEMAMDPQKILVVDDDKTNADVLAEYLKYIGHSAVPVSGKEDAGKKALEAFRECSECEPFDLVFTDLTMSPIDGRGLLAELRKITPWVKVIVTTGYSNNECVNDPAKFGFSAALPKPFKKETIISAVEKALGG